MSVAVVEGGTSVWIRHLFGPCPIFVPAVIWDHIPSYSAGFAKDFEGRALCNANVALGGTCNVEIYMPAQPKVRRLPSRWQVHLDGMLRHCCCRQLVGDGPASSISCAAHAQGRMQICALSCAVMGHTVYALLLQVRSTAMPCARSYI